MDRIQVCKKCGTECIGEYLGDHPCIDYYCDLCGNSWCDEKEFMNEVCDQADNLRKQMKEGDYEGSNVSTDTLGVKTRA